MQYQQRKCNHKHYHQHYRRRPVIIIRSCSKVRFRLKDTLMLLFSIPRCVKHIPVPANSAVTTCHNVATCECQLAAMDTYLYIATPPGFGWFNCFKAQLPYLYIATPPGFGWFNCFKAQLPPRRYWRVLVGSTALKPSCLIYI